MVAHAQQQPQREFAFSDRDFRFLVELANKKTGIVLNDQKRDMVYARISRRLRVLGYSEFAPYCELLKTSDGDAEMGHLVNAITTNLTHFFREKHHFEHLHQAVLLPLQAAGGRRCVFGRRGVPRAWSPVALR